MVGIFVLKVPSTLEFELDVFPLRLFLPHVPSPTHYLVWNRESGKYSTMIWTQLQCVRNAAFQNGNIHSVQNEINCHDFHNLLQIHQENCLGVPHAIRCWSFFPRWFCSVNAPLHPKQSVTYHKHFANPPLNILHGAYIMKWIEHNDVYNANPKTQVHPWAMLLAHLDEHVYCATKYGHTSCLNVFEHFWKRHCKLDSGCKCRLLSSKLVCAPRIHDCETFCLGWNCPYPEAQRPRLCFFLLLFLACQQSLCSCQPHRLEFRTLLQIIPCSPSIIPLDIETSVLGRHLQHQCASYIKMSVQIINFELLFDKPPLTQLPSKTHKEQFPCSDWDR